MHSNPTFGSTSQGTSGDAAERLPKKSARHGRGVLLGMVSERIGESLAQRFGSPADRCRGDCDADIHFIHAVEAWELLFYGDEPEGIVEGSTGGPRPISVDSFSDVLGGVIRRAVSGT